MTPYSVTTALKPFFPHDIPQHYLDRASERGTAVHRAAANYANGIPIMWFPDELGGYFKSFKNWFDTYVDKVVFVEKRMRDDDFKYNGQPDLGCRLIDGRYVIVDYKTPLAEYATWKLQISGYCHLARAAYPDIPWCGGMSLRLRPNGGKAKATVYVDTARDFAVFLSALNVYRYIS